MGNRTSGLGTPLKPSGLTKSEPKSEPKNDGEWSDKGKQAKAAVIKVMGSPQNVRKSSASQSASPLVANPKFFGTEKSVEARAPRAAMLKPRDSRRGSIGPGSRSPSVERKSVSTEAKLAKQNKAAAARELANAQESIRDYKAGASKLLQQWKGQPELRSLDKLLQLDTELVQFLGRIFSLAEELEKTGYSLGDIIECGVHFLRSCLDPEAPTVSLAGTIFEGEDVLYYRHLNSFFNLVASDLRYQDDWHKDVAVGSVVDFRDEALSRKVDDTLSALCKVWDAMTQADLFDAWDS